MVGDTAGLTLPDLTETVAWIVASDHPAALLLLARAGSAPGLRIDVAAARARLTRTPEVANALAEQGSDGSWGPDPDPLGRVGPTLWTVKALVEMGLDGEVEPVARAVDFLLEHATTEDGVFSWDGTRRLVLSCYVGMAAELYALTGREADAQAQVEWIRRYQEVQHQGSSLRTDPVEHWGEGLERRYGGCMKETTCLVGLAWTGRGLHAAGVKVGDNGTGPALDAMRRAFLERRLLRSGSGGVVPIGVNPKESERWLVPTFPLGWHPDLIGVLDFVASTGARDTRLQEAVDRLLGFRLADGSWPVRRHYTPDTLKREGRRNPRVGDPVVTARVFNALRACGAPVGSPSVA